MDQRIAKLKKHVSSGTRLEAAFELLDLTDTEPAAEKALQELAGMGRGSAHAALDWGNAGQQDKQAAVRRRPCSKSTPVLRVKRRLMGCA